MKRKRQITQWVIAHVVVGITILLIGLIVTSLRKSYRIGRLEGELYKAQVCNKVFVTYFKCNLGIHINLDKLYEDGVKWVDDPQYQCE